MFKKISFFSLLVCFCSFLAVADEPVKSVNYQWLTMGKPSGAQTVTYYKDGHVETEFYFTDRGRGLKIKESIWLNEQGLVTQQKVTGKSYMGSPVDEVFSMSGNKASWKNTQENETINNVREKFYIAADGVPQDLEFLVRAINKAPSKTLSLLPSGSAQYKNLLTTEIKNDKGELK